MATSSDRSGVHHLQDRVDGPRRAVHKCTEQMGIAALLYLGAVTLHPCNGSSSSISCSYVPDSHVRSHVHICVHTSPKCTHACTHRQAPDRRADRP